MSNKPTKILRYDLGEELQEVFNQLDLIKGSFDSLSERFSNIDISMFSTDERNVVQDLIDAYNNDFKGHVSERINKVEGLIEGVSAEQLEEGNTQETFEYVDGNVTRHTCTGDRNFVVTYAYKNDGSGEIERSTKSYTKANGDSVSIEKVYSYTDGDIVGIETTTTITPVQG